MENHPTHTQDTTVNVNHTMMITALCNMTCMFYGFISLSKMPTLYYETLPHVRVALGATLFKCIRSHEYMCLQ